MFARKLWSGWHTDAHIPVPIPARPSPYVPDWSRLKFNPLGLYDLRRNLGAFPDEPGIFTTYKNQFMQSDIAWFAAGLHSDGQHTTPVDGYHPLFFTVREHTGTGEPAKKLRNHLRDSIRDAIFDMVSPRTHTFEQLAHQFQATLWDRAYGGYTMILHVDGAIPPASLPLPENLEAHVYLPPNLLGEFQTAHEPIAHVVQCFIEAVGVPTAMRRQRAEAALGWLLMDDTEAVPAPPACSPSTINHNTSQTAHYVFSGRPYGSLMHPASPFHSISPPKQSTFEQLHESCQDIHPKCAAILEQNESLRQLLRACHRREAELEASCAMLQRQSQVAVNSEGQEGADTWSNTSAVRTTVAMPHTMPSPYVASTSSSRNFLPSSISGTRFPSSSSPSPPTPFHTQSIHLPPTVSQHSAEFGTFTREFINDNGLIAQGDQIHRQLRQLYENFGPEHWQLAMIDWFDEGDEEFACLMAGDLFLAMRADAKTLQKSDITKLATST